MAVKEQKEFEVNLFLLVGLFIVGVFLFLSFLGSIKLINEGEVGVASYSTYPEEGSHDTPKPT